MKITTFVIPDGSNRESSVFCLHEEKTKTLDPRSGSGMTGGEVEDDRGLERGSRNEKLQTVEGIG